ncbi:GTPase IMAP family member 8-like isoform X2 [Onychostoma macrolepis]|uniref:AIG1-type G domain-containing protein n=1 Tax=Onychostoma macrolepis TaxID=369639 RepID=A0A7J6C8Z4_9TELE|nr:GTPase IMAP family member 8-like isoform X2 [Onychostoma macrolepis]KAF4103779.1 hypothetical protein G5714_014766 [Onychostoma macrolepis]
MASAYEGDSGDDLRIVLLGVSGAGKSLLGNAILGGEAFKESRTRKSEIQTGRVEDRNISIIDTPGFFNTQLTDEEMKQQMMNSLYLAHPGPQVFLLVINLENFRKEQRDIVEQIQENFGAQALKFTIVLFFGREQMSRIKWMLFIHDTKFQELVSHCRNNYHVINSKNEIKLSHTTELLEKIDEIIKQNNHQYYNNDIYLKPLTKIRIKKEKQEGKNSNKATAREEEMKQEQINIVWDRFAMGSLKKLTPIEQNLIGADLRIVLVGKTGFGKSASGNTILGQKMFTEQLSSQSVTVKCQQHQQMVDGKIVSVIDTPGLCDTSMSEEQLKNELVKCVEMSLPGPHAFLLVIRLDERFTNEQKITVKWIQRNFGEDAAHYTIILFTRGDQLDIPIEEFLTRDEAFKSLIEQCKGRYHVFNNRDKNRDQVNKLLEKIDKMVMENRGQHYTSNMYKDAQRKIREEERKQREEERKIIEAYEENVRQEEKNRLKKKVKNVALVAGAVVGAGAAVTGGAALVAATGGVALPVVLIGGGAVISGGTSGKLIADKIKEIRRGVNSIPLTVNLTKTSN